MYAYLDQISTLHYIITYILFQKSFFLQPKNVLLEYCPTSFFFTKIPNWHFYNLHIRNLRNNLIPVITYLLTLPTHQSYKQLL